MQKENRKKMGNNKIYIVIIALLVAFSYKCPYDFFLGISCPGCGMTRAFLSLAQLDFEKAFYYHPLFGVVIIVAIYLLLEHMQKVSLKTQYRNLGIGIVCGLFIVVYVWRMFTGSEIVAFHPQDSMIGKAIELLKGIK